MVNITAGLLDLLLEMADDAEPGSVTIRLAVTEVSEMDDTLDLDPGTSVFTDLYFPNSGDSIEAVFGVDVSVPPGQTPGVFISHPDGTLDIDVTDDFAECIFIAIPPWDRTSVAVFGRDGRELPLDIIDIEPTRHSIDEGES